MNTTEPSTIVDSMDGADTLPFVAISESTQRHASAYLVLALHYQRPMDGGARFDLSGLEEVRIGRGSACHQAYVVDRARTALNITVPDAWMSTQHVVLERVGSRWMLSDRGSTNGTRVNGERAQRANLVDSDLIEMGNTLFLFRDGVRHEGEALGTLHADDLLAGPAAMATFNPLLQQEIDKLLKFTCTGTPILLRGESGTGKELVARMIHDISRRRGDFVAVNCGALPDSLIESELFGHRKGAFSGAVQDRPGLIRSAHRGTFFLDEIGELPEASQAVLLRVLQEREVVPIGEVNPIRVDIRVISATHRDLWARVEQGTFRKDLYARLCGFGVSLPPLRERREDLGLLITSMLRRLCAGAGAGASLTLQPEAARALFTYDWPLNIRELEQILSVAVTLADGKSIRLAHLPERLRGLGPAPAESAALTGEDQRTRTALVNLLKEHRGNISAVGRAMGKARVQIRRMCKRYAIDVACFRA